MRQTGELPFFRLPSREKRRPIAIRNDPKAESFPPFAPAPQGRAPKCGRKTAYRNTAHLRQISGKSLKESFPQERPFVRRETFPFVPDRPLHPDRSRTDIPPVPFPALEYFQGYIYTPPLLRPKGPDKVFFLLLASEKQRFFVRGDKRTVASYRALQGYSEPESYSGISPAPSFFRVVHFDKRKKNRTFFTQLIRENPAENSLQPLFQVTGKQGQQR